MELRAYQQTSIDGLYGWWRKHPAITDCPLLVLPTGAGKSVVIAELVRLLFDTWPESHPRTVVLVPSKELAEQNADKLMRILPSHIRVGYYSASLGRKQPDADVIVATIGSIAKNAHLLGNIRCVVIDECFVGDTHISTPLGSREIEAIAVGDEVNTATGTGIVKAVSRRSAKEIITVRLSNGNEIRTTDNHPFFTNAGWKAAGKLARGDVLVGIQDMPEMWRGFSTLESRGRNREGVQDSTEKVIRESTILLDILFQDRAEPDDEPRRRSKDAKHIKEDWAQAVASGWERTRTDFPAGSVAFDLAKWMGARTSDMHQSPEEQWGISDKLQGRYRKQQPENCDRAGRAISRGEAETLGHEERQLPCFTWVESVSREKLSSPIPVFNLQVGGHPSYFANGVLVHNCHLVNPDGAGQYRQFLNDLARYCVFRVVGFTATPFRGNGVWLTDGDEPLFTGIAHETPVSELLQAGYLSPLIRPIDAIQSRIDTSGISTSNGDYNIGQLSDRVSDYLPAAADEACTLAVDRHKWIAFLPTVANAEAFAELLNQRGIPTLVVCGDTPKKEREQRIASFRRGEVRCLVTVLALATGFDVPDVDCIIWLRPTQSPVLYVQGAGRGLRIADGKQNCLWVDFSDTTERLGPVDGIRGRKRGRKKLEAVAPFAVCGECGNQVRPASSLECPDCGAALREPEPEEARAASNAAIMAHQVQPKINTYPIDRVSYARHQKPGSPDSLRAEYWCGLRIVAREWVCLDHQGFARAKAERWWAQRNPEGFGFVPGSVDQAFEWLDDGFELRKPESITINESGKYPEIVNYQWEPAYEPHAA